jgi:hypothetical protein
LGHRALVAGKDAGLPALSEVDFTSSSEQDAWVHASFGVTVSGTIVVWVAPRRRERALTMSA